MADCIAFFLQIFPVAFLRAAVCFIIYIIFGIRGVYDAFIVSLLVDAKIIEEKIDNLVSTHSINYISQPDYRLI